MKITARDIIKRWPSRAEMAEDAGGALQQVHDWWRRDKINPEHDVALVMGAKARGVPLSFDELAWSRVPDHLHELLNARSANRQPAKCADSGQFTQIGEGQCLGG